MIIASIDPGAETGMVIVSLSERAQTIFRSVEIGRQSMYDLDHARLVAAYVIKTLRAANDRSSSQQRAPLFEKTRQYLVQHDVDEVVIERPADIFLGGFKSDKRKKSGEAVGTAFGLGNHFGLIEAAALDADVDRIACYKIRSAKGEIGWMQRREKLVPARELTLLRARARMKDLAQRPYDGVIRSIESCENENVLMALGVLEFHCDRQRDRV